MQLLLGCGTSREKRLIVKEDDPKEFDETLTTVDINPNVGADIVWDLNMPSWPIASEQYDEVHAYEVLEHLGQQGDVQSFFRTFSEIHRILVPGGHLLATVPRFDSVWAWGDPGHTRIINEGSLAFLNQEMYGKPPMTDYRNIWTGDLRTVATGKTDHNFLFILQKHVKTPSNS